jgi:predicted transcriptional regulator
MPYSRVPIQLRLSIMCCAESLGGNTMRNYPEFILTESQAACLIALRQGKDTKPNVAIEARLDLPKAARRLEALRQFGLAGQDQTKRWRVTSLGKTCFFETVPDQRGRNEPAGPLGRRLLGLLDRPMRGAVVMEKLGISPQLFRQMTIKLHAQGRLRFGDPEYPSWIVMRANDFTPLLSRGEERVLWAIPPGRAVSFSKLKSLTRMPEDKMAQALESLIEEGFAEAAGGLREQPAYCLTEAGAGHPQRIQTARRRSPVAPSPAARPPVRSDRVRKVLSTILAAETLRIKDLAGTLELPPQTVNSLVQYLKRKQLVRQTAQELGAPYSLTPEGQAVLAEMTLYNIGQGLCANG